MAKNYPTIEELSQYLVCDSKNGFLIWKNRTPDMYQDGLQSKESKCIKFNRSRAGERADGISHNLYRTVSFPNKKKLYAHIIIWSMVHGFYPECGYEIDHINGDPSDNRIENLRIATSAQQKQNKRKWSSRDLPKGVYKYKSNPRKFRSLIENQYLGVFDTVEDAYEAYKIEAEKRFGKFART